jgi:hypothetical protein
VDLNSIQLTSEKIEQMNQEEALQQSSSESESSVDVKIVQKRAKLPAEEVYIKEREEDEGSDESETRPKVVIHITVKSGGPTLIPTAEVRVFRSSHQRVKVCSELRVEQETIDIDRGIDTYTTLWRSDGKPLQFQIEIREAKSDPPSLDTYQWEGPGLPLRKIEKPKEFKREEPESSVSSGPE